MNWILQWLRAHRIFRLGWPVFFQDEVRVTWTDADAMNLRMFLNTPTGEKVRRVIRVQMSRNEAEAVSTHKGDAYECGVARGWREAGSFVISLSEPSPPQRDEPEYGMAEAHDALATQAS